MSNDFSELHLVACEPITSHGFALPLFGQQSRANTLYVAHCYPPGDHVGRITEFEPYEPSNPLWLPESLQLPSFTGGPWLDVFLWDGAPIATGVPSDVWAALQSNFDGIAAGAPLSLLDAAIHAARPERDDLARAACGYIEERFGTQRARYWAVDLIAKGLQVTLAHCTAAQHLAAELANTIKSIRIETNPNAGIVALRLEENGQDGLARVLAPLLFDTQKLGTSLGVRLQIAQQFVDDLASNFRSKVVERETFGHFPPSLSANGPGKPKALSSKPHQLGGRPLMYGPEILVRTLSIATREDRLGKRWQYHSRSDHHSKVACWSIIFDLLRTTPLLQRHVKKGIVHFGINHEMRDFVHDRKKNLDLVLCTSARTTPFNVTLDSIASDYNIQLTETERSELAHLPILRRAPVGSVLMALEAKACMTAHQRALPRLYDELNSSHLTVHGASDQAIAAGFAMVNISARYLSPDLNKSDRISEPKWSKHQQPRDAQLAVDKIRQLPRRSKTGDTGYDALSIVVVDCANDGSPIELVTGAPAPQPGDIYHYATMIDRLGHVYTTRFKDI